MSYVCFPCCYVLGSLIAGQLSNFQLSVVAGFYYNLMPFLVPAALQSVLSAFNMTLAHLQDKRPQLGEGVVAWPVCTAQGGLSFLHKKNTICMHDVPNHLK